MAHVVKADVHTKVVGNKDIEIKVKTNAGKLGTLLISKGNIEWLPKWKSTNKKRFSWLKFATIMESEGKPAKKKR